MSSLNRSGRTVSRSSGEVRRRFLNADGAIVVLAEGTVLRVSRPPERWSLCGELSDDSTAVRRTIGGSHIEVARGRHPTVRLIGGMVVRSAAVAPCRPRVSRWAPCSGRPSGRSLSAEDRWLFSTVATNASVVLATSRLYEMVRRSEAEWRTAFNALAEGIAVWADRSGAPANRALARSLEPRVGAPGRNFGDDDPGPPEAVAGLIKAAYRGERNRAHGGTAGG